jgi:endonuclease/exonuclease/phosphatase family metal-dependent hydrolase
MTGRTLIRVMSFNLRYAQADDGPNRWDRRKRLAVERIRAFNPDLLGMQECSAGPQAAYVRRHLSGWDFQGVPTEDADWPVEMAPIFVKRRAFEMIAAGHFWLSDTPDVPGSKSWGAAFARTATWARLRHRRTGRTLLFLNTHVDYEPDAVKQSGQLLKRWLDRTTDRVPAIVTGDFNADKQSLAYRRLTRGGLLRDAFRAGTPAVKKDEGSFHGFGSLDPPTPIDWILVSRPFVVVAAHVDQTRDGNRFPSDHYPVTAVFAWAGRRTRIGRW